MTIDAPTKMSDFSGFLTREQSQPIFKKVAQTSIVQRLAQEVTLGAEGKAIPVFTGTPTAAFVSEGSQKPTTSGGMALVNMDPKKIATIFVVSAEVVRANPGGFMDEMKDKVAEAFAVTFDTAAIHGTSSPYADAITDTTKSVELGGNAASAGGVYKDLVDALGELVAADKELTGWALSTRAEPRLLGAVDTAGHPIFAELPATETAPAVRNLRLLGRPAAMGRTVHADPTVEIIGGDWQEAAWGVTSGISYDVSTEATVTIDGNLVSLWEHNLVAVRAEAEYGFVINDVDAFVLGLNNVGS